MKKKLFGIIVILFVVLSIIIVLSLNNNKENLIYDESIISNSFEYEQAITSESIEDKYFYSDSYFKESSKKENEHLRTFALSLVVSFNPTNRKEEVNYNLNKILEELNFSDLEYYDLNVFNKETIGTSIAHKKLNDKYELVVVTLRGGGYQNEWESNFDSGEKGDIKGFNEASLTVLSRINSYIDKHNIKNYKLLVSGYSRSGAISGLVGVHINNNLKKYNMEENNLFIYSFESPRYSNNDKKYDNIHNIINKNDIITYIYPETWKLYHSGVNEEITTESKNIKEKYLDLFSSEKIKDLGEIDIQRFIRKFISIVSSDREAYYNISNSVINLYKLICSKSSSELADLVKFLKNTKINFDLSNSLNLLTLLGSDDKKSVKNAFDSLLSNYDKEYYKIKNILNENEYNDLKDYLFDIFLFFQPALKDDYKSDKMFINFITFGYNIKDIIHEHYFSTTFDQVKKKDSYYNENAQ